MLKFRQHVSFVKGHVCAEFGRNRLKLTYTFPLNPKFRRPITLPQRRREAPLASGLLLSMVGTRQKWTLLFNASRCSTGITEYGCYFPIQMHWIEIWTPITPPLNGLMGWNLYWKLTGRRAINAPKMNNARQTVWSQSTPCATIGALSAL